MIQSVKTSYNTQIKWMSKKLNHENLQKTAAMQKIEDLQAMMHQNMAKPTVGNEDNGVWKDKCKELVEICKALRNENEIFRSMLEENSKTKKIPINPEEIPKKKEKRNDTSYSLETGSSGKKIINRESGNSYIGVNGTGMANKTNPYFNQGVQTRSSSHTGINKSYSNQEQVAAGYQK